MDWEFYNTSAMYQGEETLIISIAGISPNTLYPYVCGVPIGSADFVKNYITVNDLQLVIKPQIHAILGAIANERTSDD